MYPNLIIKDLDEVWFEVSIPKVVFELCIEGMTREVEGLDDFDGLYVSKG